MDKDELEAQLHLNIRDMAKHFGRSAAAISYWLRKHNLSVGRRVGPRPEFAIAGTEKGCTICKVVQPLTEFYKNSKPGSRHSYCRTCMNQRTRARQRAFKDQCIQYKGGSCENCGYNNYQGALDFHHRDPLEKDFEISKVKCLKFDEAIWAELDKCLLLCANCHREVHGGILRLP